MASLLLLNCSIARSLCREFYHGASSPHLIGRTTVTGILDFKPGCLLREQAHYKIS